MLITIPVKLFLPKNGTKQNYHTKELQPVFLDALASLYFKLSLKVSQSYFFLDFQILNDNQWYLTKLVGEIFLWYKYPCYVNDISRSKLMRYVCGTSFPAISMIFHEVSWWDVFVVQVSLLCQWYFAKLVG